MRLFPVLPSHISVYWIFQTNWIRKESMIAFSLAKYRPLTAEKLLELFNFNNKWSKGFSSWNRTKVASTLPNGSI
jgi:hypothetical protein